MARTTTKSNKNNEIYATIQEGISNGRYPGGTFLVEGDLCQEFDVSRTPVREALIRLEKDQFIELIPNRGAYIPHITLNDIIELCQLRKVNDGLAAWLAVERQTPEVVQQLDECVARQTALLESENPTPLDVRREDFLFHDLIMENCGNKRLIAVLTQIKNQMERATNLSADRTALETLTISLGYHRRIVEAFHERDCKKAKELFEEHWVAMSDGYIRRDLAGQLPQIL